MSTRPFRFDVDLIAYRALGLSTPVSFRNAMRSALGQTVVLREDIDIEPGHHSFVSALDIENIDGRYMLSGGHDGNIVIHDVGRKAEPGAKILPLITATGQDQQNQQNRPTRARTPQRRHSHLISSVQWYPVDTGIFITSCKGGLVKVWDANRFEPVSKFVLGKRVNCAVMSSVATRHQLVAVGTNEKFISLCDLRTGGATQCLEGHGGQILSIAWSPINEYIVATGSSDRSVRLWDVRKSSYSSCLQIFDRLETKATRQKRTKESLTPSVCASSDVDGRRSHQFKRRRISGPIGLFDKSVTTSHTGEVTGVSFSPDGFFLVSVSARKMMCWSTMDATNMRVDYSRFFSPFQSQESPLMVVQSGASKDARILVPDDLGDIMMYSLHDGTLLGTLSGHFEAVTCLAKRDIGGEVKFYSGSQDNSIFAWGAPRIHEDHKARR
eukprot:Stramenopile-MAST_4_protein_371